MRSDSARRGVIGVLDPRAWVRHGRALVLVLALCGCAGPRLPTLQATRASPDVGHGVGCSEGVGCPKRDSDGDGREDRADRCPNVRGEPYDGCPVPDSDGDGRLDHEDRCRSAAEVWNGFADRDGCPDEIPADLAVFTGTIRGVEFHPPDKETLRPGSYPVLDRLVAVLLKYPDVRVEVSAHHAVGDGDRYLRWGVDPSLRQAFRIRRYLVERGIDEARIQARGAGSEEPIANNRTAAGREKNRRIEVVILVAR